MPVNSLEISMHAVQSAVVLVCALLLPQAALLFDYQGHDNHGPEQAPPSGASRTMTKQEKLFFQIQLFILNIKFKFFHKSCITDHHFRDKRALVDSALNDLVLHRLLHQAPIEKPFFSSRRVSAVKTYLKYLPTAAEEASFRDSLCNHFNIDYDEYRETFVHAQLLPSTCKLTPHGYDFVRQSQYELPLNNDSEHVPRHPRCYVPSPHNISFISDEKPSHPIADQTNTVTYDSRANPAGRKSFSIKAIDEIRRLTSSMILFMKKNVYRHVPLQNRVTRECEPARSVESMLLDQCVCVCVCDSGMGTRTVDRGHRCLAMH